MRAHDVTLTSCGNLQSNRHRSPLAENGLEHRNRLMFSILLSTIYLRDPSMYPSYVQLLS